jgi:hypothetical protein
MASTAMVARPMAVFPGVEERLLLSTRQAPISLSSNQ